MRYRSRLMTLSLVLALATASGCLSSTNQVKPPSRTQNISGIGGKTLTSAMLGGVVEMPSSQVSTDGTKLAYALASISKETPCIGAAVTARDAQMALAPNSDSAEKTGSDGKFLLKSVPPDIVLYVTAQFNGVQLATIATASSKHEVDVTIDLASTLAAAGLLQLFVDQDTTHPAPFQLANLSVPLYNNLVTAVEQALTDSTTSKPAAALKTLTADFNTLKGQNAAVQQAYNAIVGDLNAKQGTTGGGGATPSPGSSAGASPSPGASPSATPSAGSSTTPSATPTTRTFPAIEGTVSPVANATSTAGFKAIEMAAIEPSGLIPGALLVPAGNHILTLDTSDKPKTYGATELGINFSGARAIALNGTSTAYMIATVNSQLSLITIDVTKLLTNPQTASTVQTINGLPTNSQLDEMAFDSASGKIYVADELDQTVHAIVPSSGQVEPFMGVSGSSGNSTSGALTSFQLKSPTGVAIDGSTLYVADSNNSRLIKVDLSAQTATVLTGDPSHTTLTDQSLANARFNTPLELFVTTDHKLLVADQNNQALRQVDPAGDSVVSFEQAGQTDPSGMVSFPAGVAKFNGNVYALDSSGHLQKFVPNP